jgi:hypothetical protein
LSSGTDVVSRTGTWIREVDFISPGDLNGQLQILLSGVTAKLSVWQELARRFKCDVFCGLFMSSANDGDELKPETMLMLGTRGLSLQLDIYGLSE